MGPNRLLKQAQEREHLELALLEAKGHAVPDAASLSAEARLSAEQWLRANHLIGEPMLSGSFRLTHDGQTLAEDLYQSRISGERRRDLVLRAILQAAEQGTPPDAVTKVDGREVAFKERQIALARIERWGLGRLTRAWGGDVVSVVPGEAVAEALAVRGLLKDRFEPEMGRDYTVSNTTNISDSTVATVTTGGANNTMHVNQTVNPLEADVIVSKIGDILDALSDGDSVEPLIQAVEEIRDAATSSQPSKQSVREKVASSLEVAADVSSVVSAAPVAARAVPMLIALATSLGV